MGDKVEVFVYHDSKDRLIATINRPKVTLGEIGHLMVADTTKVGVFLDWGLERIYFTLAETVGSLEKGKKYLVVFMLINLVDYVVQ